MSLIRNVLLLAAALFAIGLLVSNLSAQVKVNNNELKNLAGNWDGELEYLDYQNDKSKTLLKLRSLNTVKDGKVSQEIVYIEPNGKEVKSGDSFALSPDGRQIVEEKMKWTITKNVFDKKAKTRTIIYETKWKDNNRDADLRETLIIKANEFSVTKEVRYENTTDFFIRNTHRYTRK
jgi:hypothetical protein